MQCYKCNHYLLEKNNQVLKDGLWYCNNCAHANIEGILSDITKIKDIINNNNFERLVTYSHTKSIMVDLLSVEYNPTKEKALLEETILNAGKKINYLDDTLLLPSTSKETPKTSYLTNILIITNLLSIIYILYLLYTKYIKKKNI